MFWLWLSLTFPLICTSSISLSIKSELASQLAIIETPLFPNMNPIILNITLISSLSAALKAFLSSNFHFLNIIVNSFEMSYLYLPILM